MIYRGLAIKYDIAAFWLHYFSGIGDINCDCCTQIS